MLKEMISDHMVSVGTDAILEDVSNYKGPAVGSDILAIRREDAIEAGVNKYHLPGAVARWLAAPAVDSSLTGKNPWRIN